MRYISCDLQNPAAAARLAERLVEAAERIPEFPYANPSYVPIRPLKHEYRKLLAEHYWIFYRVDEAEQRVTVARVIHAKRDLNKIME